ncbi:lysylphosphatidylglycerol synthase domain-containing protein [Pedobacter sp. SL55]|uniref:lysylphosphatidylglycerol synthase domain-containing protein n=1 Tax=Pedobacter sp. SL55 TaxID=2995161 RepID=UPI00226EC886|nr:lysylphosphatidylglycerol synthase domain-containing protein [Pedobacter sp. SL55]WAC41114.1 lysylphosphatidylglycerol synthase domain-containing protein [Pedobacter sp. SL55]
MTSSYKKILANIIKIAIVAFAFWFIYRKLTNHNDLREFVTLLQNIPLQQIWLILGSVFVLMLFNWGLETVKWKQLIARVEQISLWRSIESVFCGLTWAIFTPNRLGEYGGRVFFLSPKRRIIGVVAMTVGNIGQLVLTNVFGAIAVCVFVYRFIPLEPILLAAICGLALVFALFFLVFYFNIKWLNSLLLSVKITRKYKKFYAVLARYKKVELLKILLLCLARYAVFTTQYLIMFVWLVPHLSMADIVMLVPILFFVQSTLPSLDLLDIGIRSVTALFFFKYVTDQNAAVVACIASIWLINIIIPAILGSYFVFKLNFFGNTRRN